MKNIITIIAFLFAVCLFTSCQEEEITPKNQLNTVGEHSQSEDPGQWD